MRFLPAILALPLACASTIAVADTLDYRFDGVNSELCGIFGGDECRTQTLEFTIDSGLPTSYDASSVTFESPSVRIIQDTTSTSADSQVTFTKGGLMDLPGDGETEVWLGGLPGGSFLGPTSNPTLLTGSGESSLYLYFTSYSLDGTLTVTDQDATPAPEPGSIALLATGIVGGIGALRRRRRLA